MPIEPSALNQAHHSGTALARTKQAGEQPVVAAEGNRSDLVLDVVVVNGQLPVIDKAGQRLPTPRAVVQGFGGGRAISNLKLKLKLEDYSTATKVELVAELQTEH